MVAYLGAGLAALGRLPTRHRIVIERVFDESEGTQLIVHSPFGGRINRALGLALRKRFCVSFDFELQAAADDDTVVLSLGPQHSFPLTDVPTMLRSTTAVEVLTQAMMLHPMLAARWRWNLNRALVVPRSRGGQRRPIHLQRMEAEDLLAAVWPALAACQENTPPGPVVVPDHVLARQTVTDCLTEPLDADGLVSLLEDMEAGRIGVHFVESAEPSPLAHGILTGRPYTFLDGAPLEERRTGPWPSHAASGRSAPPGCRPGLPVTASELAPFDPGALAEVLEQVEPRPRTADELHDLLLSLVRCRPGGVLAALVRRAGRDGRVSVVGDAWVATERLGGGPRHRALPRPPTPSRSMVVPRPPTVTARWPSAWPAISNWPDRSPSSGWWQTRRCRPARSAARRSLRPGPAPGWPASKGRASPCSCPTGAGARGTSSPDCTLPAGTVGGGGSSRPASPTSSAFWPAGNTWLPGPRPRVGPG